MTSMSRRISVILFFCFMMQALSFVTAVHASEPQPDLVSNGGFESVKSGAGKWAAGAEPVGWGLWLASGTGKASVTGDVYHTGTQAVQLEHLALSRTGLSQDVPIAGGQTYKLSVWVKTKDVNSGIGVFVRTQFFKSIKGFDGKTLDEKIGSGPSTEELTGTQDWMKREVIINSPEDAKYIRLEPFFETGTGTVWFDDISLVKWNSVTGLALDQTSVTMDTKQTAVLTAKVTPENVSGLSLQWRVDNKDAVQVEAQGSLAVLTALKPGKAIVTVMTEDGTFAATSEITVKEAGIQGDLTNDGKITVGDLAMAAAHFGKDTSSPDWETVKAADVNGDHKIDRSDLMWFAERIFP
ncbi:Ig-like domain-containing protein [Paenibacillus sp. UNC499MF]|uniref:Ig-like domain-containing protein n=1 Tax=Paenibacillus sp. UNC499MF TaxID=1502751 RepID=UPI0008A02280|nr:Ig-like domain-containing protein [Paenibacillus sp. UNC499MF]SEG15071.1 Ig-like domain (group 2) [Paenibacillus sp. UNC499MF]